MITGNANTAARMILNGIERLSAITPLRNATRQVASCLFGGINPPLPTGTSYTEET